MGGFAVFYEGYLNADRQPTVDELNELGTRAIRYFNKSQKYDARALERLDLQGQMPAFGDIDVMRIAVGLWYGFRANRYAHLADSALKEYQRWTGFAETENQLSEPPSLDDPETF